RLWDAATGEARGVLGGYRVEGGGILQRPPGLVCVIAVSRDGKLLASFGPEKTILLWDVAARRDVKQFTAAEAPQCGALAPDGKTLAFGGNRVHLRDVATGRDPRPFPGQEGSVWCTAYSPDGKTVALAGDDAVIRLWDAATTRELARCEGHGLEVL